MLERLEIVRLLVRERSGAHYVDQGYMPRGLADSRRKEWNSSGYGTLMLKHTLTTVKIVRPAVLRPFGY